ncbi:cell death abnormality 1-like isoform X1 [Brachionus plicatilis]|uniref:Cell death abnormality 1-like isoform X1 n=1 Tax=Brachionus plicatilis TaxID=10195 RepID=A0A3M7R512_BRAPC|nr:cell death abnormality 1-like isoform X1 [Brachionus plicatilis]
MLEKLSILIVSLVVMSEASWRGRRQACDQSMDFSPVPGDCNKFYRCAHGQLVVMDCSSGLYFDNNLKICNWQDQVACPSSSGSSTCDPASDLTQVPNDCSKFYRCINGVLSVLSCPNGYLFDQNAKACNPSSQVSTCYTSCSPSIDLTPVVGNCSQFYRCVNDKQTILSCPPGYLFDREAKTCNPANQVNCNLCDPNLDLTPYPNDCSKFYRCVNGVLSTITCPSGFLFDKNSKTCKSSEQVNCATCDPSIDLTQVPNDCSRFYRCINGVLSTLTCPSGYLFDSSAKACNPSTQVNCNSCDPSIDLTQVPNDCSKFYRCVNGQQSILACPSGYLFDSNAKACNPESQVPNCYSCASQNLVNVPGDCSRYYLCLNNVLTIYNCPAGLSFDNSVQNCRVTSEIVGKCGTNSFSNCPFSLTSSSRIELCAQSGFKNDYPACC